jgi:hypothetical protein
MAPSAPTLTWPMKPINAHAEKAEDAAQRPEPFAYTVQSNHRLIAVVELSKKGLARCRDHPWR